jgi:hypothetical protein
MDDALAQPKLFSLLFSLSQGLELLAADEFQIILSDVRTVGTGFLKQG